MRKGILSLSSLGRKRSSVKKDVGTDTEKKADRKAESAAEQKPAPEKLYVQTVQVPKQRSVKSAKAQRKQVKAHRPERGK